MTRANLSQEELSQIQQKLVALEQEHRDIDNLLHNIGHNPPLDQLALQRMKKRKLLLKDQIAHFHSLLIPDIIA